MDRDPEWISDVRWLPLTVRGPPEMNPYRVRRIDGVSVEQDGRGEGSPVRRYLWYVRRPSLRVHTCVCVHVCVCAGSLGKGDKGGLTAVGVRTEGEGRSTRSSGSVSRSFRVRLEETP